MPENVLKYFPSTFLVVLYLFLWSTPPISCLLSADCYYLLMLFNQENKITTSAGIHCISLATLVILANNTSVLSVLSALHILSQCIRSYITVPSWLAFTCDHIATGSISQSCLFCLSFIICYNAPGIILLSVCLSVLSARLILSQSTRLGTTVLLSCLAFISDHNAADLLQQSCLSCLFFISCQLHQVFC
jgi:hypothetical protein